MLKAATPAAMVRPLHWQCISGCGACCRLDPELRQDALEALSPEQRQQYLAMVGPDGWCVHFDTGARRCRVYDERPDFCRVSNLVALFAPDLAEPQQPDPSSTKGEASTEAEASSWGPEADALAIACCSQQIRSEYGGRGRVMRRFQQAIRRP